MTEICLRSRRRRYETRKSVARRCPLAVPRGQLAKHRAVRQSSASRLPPGSSVTLDADFTNT